MPVCEKDVGQVPNTTRVLLPVTQANGMRSVCSNSSFAGVKGQKKKNIGCLWASGLVWPAAVECGEESRRSGPAIGR